MTFDRRLTEEQKELYAMMVEHSKVSSEVVGDGVRNDLIYLGTTIRERMTNIDLKQALSHKLDILTLTVDSKEQANFLGELRLFISTIDATKNTSEQFDKEDGLVYTDLI